MYLCGYFLINFSIPPRRSEVVTWENFVIPAVQKRDPVLPGWNVLHVIAGCILWRVYNTAGITAKRDRISSQLARIMKSPSNICKKYQKCLFYISGIAILLFSSEWVMLICNYRALTDHSRYCFASVWKWKVFISSLLWPPNWNWTGTLKIVPN